MGPAWGGGGSKPQALQGGGVRGPLRVGRTSICWECLCISRPGTFKQVASISVRLLPKPWCVGGRVMTRCELGLWSQRAWVLTWLTGGCMAVRWPLHLSAPPFLHLLKWGRRGHPPHQGSCEGYVIEFTEKAWKNSWHLAPNKCAPSCRSVPQSPSPEGPLVLPPEQTTPLASWTTEASFGLWPCWCPGHIPDPCVTLCPSRRKARALPAPPPFSGIASGAWPPELPLGLAADSLNGRARAPCTWRGSVHTLAGLRPGWEAFDLLAFLGYCTCGLC